MKTIYDAENIKEIEADITTLTQSLVLNKIAKQRQIDYYIKQANLISRQLVNLLSIKDGYELSVLFHMPQTDNRYMLKCWAVDYLIRNKVGENHQYSLSEIVETFKYEVAIKQQDFYI